MPNEKQTTLGVACAPLCAEHHLLSSSSFLVIEENTQSRVKYCTYVLMAF
jgi:hypothetical protein